MNKKIFYSVALAAAALSMTGCADGELQDFFVSKTDSIANLEYLNQYDALKTYVNRQANPNFKLGVGEGAQNYVDQDITYRLANANFDEMTAGNAMKYASCVKEDGSMDFNLVKNFVSAASDAGMTVFGHTLAWHSQQQNKYLNGLIADKAIPIDPNAKQEVTDYSVDWTKKTAYDMWCSDQTKDLITVDNKGFHIKNDAATKENYYIQYMCASGISLTKGDTYKLKVKAKASDKCNLYIGVGGWGAKADCSIVLDKEWKEYTVEFNAVEADNFALFQSGHFVGTIDVEYVKVTHGEAAAVTYYVNQLTNSKMAKGESMSNFVVREPGQEDKDGEVIEGAGPDGMNCLAVKSHANPSTDWDTQFFIYTPDKAWAAGEKYKISFWYKATEKAECATQCHAAPGAYKFWKMLPSNPSFTTEWQHYEEVATIPTEGAGMNSIAFNLNVNKNEVTYYFADIEWSIEKSGNTIPLTPEEKKDTLTWAMNKWIDGMMEACDGKVVAWDVVNEALSGADTDGDGIYDLQHAKTASAEDKENCFYWQDYLGDLDYVRTAVKAARESFAAHNGNAADLKLFINDYNLEATWDNNKKLESLIEWIKRWEADQVTKIDGIASQMHVSYNADPAKQEKQKECIVNMYKLMAKSGKLCKVSELDMGYVDAAGNVVETKNLNDTQQKEMADFYQFIIEEYFKNIPANQRYGITQWCITDAPDNSGWRKSQPVGLWTQGYDRKRAYGGFAEGLKTGSPLQ